jgi:hypothetical protein
MMNHTTFGDYYFKHLNEDSFTDKKIDKLLNDLEKRQNI